MKEWLERLLNPEESPSSYSLISLMAGITGIILFILSTFLKTIQTAETLETSKFLVLAGLGGKFSQKLFQKKKE